MIPTKNATQSPLNFDIHPFSELPILIIDVEMSIGCQGKYLLLLTRLAPICDALNTHKYFDFDLVEIGAFALHDAFLSVSLALGYTFLDHALLIKVPIFQMLIASCDKEWIVRWKSEGVDRFSQLVGSDSCLSLPFPYKQASIISISKRYEIEHIWGEHDTFYSIFMSTKMFDLFVFSRFLFNLPNCDFRLLESTLSCSKVFSIRWKGEAWVRSLQLLRIEELCLLILLRVVYTNDGSSWISHFPGHWIHGYRGPTSATQANYFLKLKLSMFSVYRLTKFSVGLVPWGYVFTPASFLKGMGLWGINTLL